MQKIDLERCIVLISGKTRDNIGTGFVIHQDKSFSYIVTCAHVVYDVGGKEDIKVANKDATVVAYGWENGNDGVDLAVIKVEKLDLSVLKLQIEARPQDSFSTLGYFYFGENKKTIGIENVKGILKRIISFTINRGEENIQHWHLENDSNNILKKGYSGSPVLNQQEQVIGVITHETNNGREGLAISINALSKLQLKEISIENLLRASDVSEGDIKELNEEDINKEPDYYVDQWVLLLRDDAFNSQHSPDNLGECLLRKNQLKKIKNDLEKHISDKKKIGSRLIIFIKEKFNKNKLAKNYILANILNLLSEFNIQKDISGLDLSGINIKGADFRDTLLVGTDFTDSEFSECTFDEPLSCIHCITFTADGSYFATGHADGVIRIHDTEKRELCCLESANSTNSAIWSLVFSPNTKKLASSDEDGNVILWNVRIQFNELIEITLDKSLSFKDTNYSNSISKNRIYSVAFSSDGQNLAVGDIEKGVILLNVETGQELKRLPCKKIYCLAVNQINNNVLATGSNDGTIKLWNTDTGDYKDLIDSNTDENTIRCIAFSPDGKTLASGGEDGKVRLWRDNNIGMNFDNVDFQPFKTISYPEVKQVRALAFSSDGRTIAVGCINIKNDSYSTEHIIKFWSLEDGDWCKILFDEHKHVIRSLAFHPKPEEKLLISGGDERKIKFWDIQRKEHTHSIYNISGYANRIWSVTSSRNSNTFACSSEDCKICILDKVDNNYKCVQLLSKHTAWVWSLAFSPDDKFLVSADEDNNIVFWERNGNQWKYKKTLKYHKQRVRCVVFSPNGSFFASAGNDKKVILWNTNSIINSNLEEVNINSAISDEFSHHDRLLSLAFSSDGKYIVSGSRDNIIKLRDINARKFVNVDETHDNQVHALAFSPDLKRKTFVSGGFDKSLKIWNIDSQGNCSCNHRSGKAHEGGILSIAFNPDPKRHHLFATAGHDRTIKLWDINSKRCIHSFQAHQSVIESITFTCDGNYLLSASQDQSIKIWDSSAEKIKSRNISIIQTIELGKPYLDMKIANVRGLEEYQIDALKSLGAKN
ncbi:trypsin-like peptidase domain-containing protein [Nostoc sphaeroides]|uniref:WD40 repeat domain-containing protein n=1 Tax=Nostoc sphaeroides CCNUC1 TaxID=2653204 RepID=A0A5P8WH02_9NOSO|nr:trypsin-like peptidase domain-containing protein [Nostoc sphaeroides]QFS52113.1 hypothetical protein GXM_09607 [Nostoc sphaeroides CCNUC1]